MTKKTLISIMVIIILFAIAAVALAAYFTDGFGLANGTAKSSEVAFNGEFIVPQVYTYTQDYKMNIYNGGKFTAEIIQNPVANFEYLRNDTVQQFIDNDVDWSEVFNLQVYDDYLTLDTQYILLDSMLSSVYNADVSKVPIITNAVPFFFLRVKSDKGETVSIPLYIVQIITGLELDTGGMLWL